MTKSGFRMVKPLFKRVKTDAYPGKVPAIGKIVRVLLPCTK